MVARRARLLWFVAVCSFACDDKTEAAGVRQEVDPVYAAGAASGISSSDLTRWNDAHSWGDHATAGYLRSEADPAFAGSPAASITATDIASWTTHDHDDRYYTKTETAGLYQAKAVGTQYLVVSPTDFVSRLGDIDYLGGQGIALRPPSTSWKLLAGVHVPGGATLVSLTCYIRDSDAGQDLIDPSDARLFRAAIPDYGSSFDTIGVVDLIVSGTPGSLARSGAISPSLAQVDNENFQYILSVTLVGSGSDDDIFDPMFRGCRIGYTLP